MRFRREMLRPFSFRRPVGGTLQMTKARNAGEARRLADIPNIGPAMVEDFRNLGIEQPGQLAGKDPYALYDRLCSVTGVRHDPRAIDTFISPLRFMNRAPPYPLCHYTIQEE